MSLAEDKIKRFQKLKSEVERKNFESLWQDSSEFCSPQHDNVNVVRTAGELKPTDRLIDVGIKSNRIFTSGLSSHLIPAGVKFFNYSTTDFRLKRDDEILRYFQDVTQITNDILNSSNFFQEFTKCLGHLGFIGTCCLLAEPADSPKYINFKSHYINEYYIAEDAYGNVDTVYFELKMTARQAYQLFGDNCSESIKNDLDNPSNSDNIHYIIHAIEPRKDYKKGSAKADERPYSSCYIEVKTKNILKETGYYELPYAVGRFYQATNEKYGRSPAMECLSTLSMLNAMEQTRIMAAQRASNPPWLSPNDGSVRRISNKSGTIIYWNASNPASKPEQLIVRDNVIVNDQAIQLKNMEVEDAFFMPLFNPLINRQNMTATETQQRVNIALQNLVPAIGRLTNELLQPIFERIYFILSRQGVYPTPPSKLLMSDGKVQIAFNSKATMAIRVLELQGVYQTLENVTFLSQFPGAQDILDNFDLDEVARETAITNSVPTNIIKSKREVQKIREARAKAEEEARTAQELQMMGNVYNSTSKTPEQGSGAQMLMQQAGLG